MLEIITTIAHLLIALASFLLALVASLTPLSVFFGLKTLNGRIACVKECDENFKVFDNRFFLMLCVVNRGYSNQTLTMLQTEGKKPGYGFVVMPFSDRGFDHEIIMEAKSVKKFKIPLEKISILDKANHLVLVNNFDRQVISSKEEIQEAVKTCREYMRKYPPS